MVPGEKEAASRRCSLLLLLVLLTLSVSGLVEQVLGAEKEGRVGRDLRELP